ncbi:hypothetical protein QR680_009680 [Steinernema hermaphroditum]|uniref:Aryl hydrocarbon receptor nuclear translocator homolog n=1 Tax=Steinernema hermaphroditum TaxID=289476 RepID=A0AA39IL87_9BILA|nr:hypothetical protein QR680_009680 [Steinernema hermaphroditum]
MASSGTNGDLGPTSSVYMDQWQSHVPTSLHQMNSDDDDLLGASMSKYARMDGLDPAIVGAGVGPAGGVPLGGMASVSGLDDGSIGISDNKERFARENHSEIERRRRNKMTHYINELAEMVPQCASLGRKPDKLTILRMAVAHMRQIRGATADPMTVQPGGSYKPSFLTDLELKHLILEAANGFLFVVCCDTGRVIFVSDSIAPILNLTQEDWLNRPIYDLVHPEDNEKVREQLCGSEASLTRILDLKTGTVKKESGAPRVHMSCRRGFICRMRIGALEPLTRLRNRRPVFTHNGQQYVVVHCTGYIKNAPPAGVVDAPASNCLVAIGRLQIASMPICNDLASPSTFSVRLSEEGKITFIDQRAADVLGIPNDPSSSGADRLLGRYWWQLAVPQDEKLLRDTFVQQMQQPPPGPHEGIVPSHIQCRLYYGGGTSEVNPVTCSIAVHKFLNPYSEQFEYVVATHQVVDQQQPPQQPSAMPWGQLDSSYAPANNGSIPVTQSNQWYPAGAPSSSWNGNDANSSSYQPNNFQ